MSHRATQSQALHVHRRVVACARLALRSRNRPVTSNATEVWSDAKADLTADHNYSSTSIIFWSSAPNGVLSGEGVSTFGR